MVNSKEKLSWIKQRKVIYAKDIAMIIGEYLMEELQKKAPHIKLIGKEYDFVDVDGTHRFSEYNIRRYNPFLIGLSNFLGKKIASVHIVIHSLLPDKINIYESSLEACAEEIVEEINREAGGNLKFFRTKDGLEKEIKTSKKPITLQEASTQIKTAPASTLFINPWEIEIPNIYKND